MNPTDYSFFQISLNSLNLFSFILGILFAMINGNLYRNRMYNWLIILLYFIGVAFYFYTKAATHG